jgi:site-specific recombinase XerD
LVNVARLRSSTINQRLQAIRCLCRWAERQGFLKSNPAAVVKSLRIAKRRRPTGLTEPELHGLLRVAGESKQGHAKRNYGLLQLLLQTGLRVSEITGLKIADVRIRDRSGEVHVREGKGNKEREVPLNASARRGLSAYLQMRPEAQPGESLFLSDRNGAFSPRAVQTLLQRLARRAKIARLRVTPHLLRHTFALNYLRQNPGKLVELANLLGHESLDTTAIYTQPSGEELAEDLKIGYARVSTLEQNLDLQLQALKKAGCRRTFQEKISAGTRNRPEFQRMLDQIRAGDTIVVRKLDRLARSTRDLLETMETIQQAGGKFQSFIGAMGFYEAGCQASPAKKGLF